MTCNPKTDGTQTHHYLRRLLAPGYAKVYLAVHRVLGCPAVVHTPTRREERLPAGMEVVVTTGDEPANLTVEVRRGASGPLVELLEDGANLLRTTLPLPGVLEHLQRAPRPRTAPRVRPAWSPWVGPAVLAAGVVLALWPQTLHDVRPPPAPVEVVVQVQATDEDTALADILQFSSSKEPMTVQRRIIIPDKPLKGQDTPPCASPSRPVNGGCWLELKDPPPCPKNSAEHAGGCWVPVRGEKAMPMSIDRRRP